MQRCGRVKGVRTPLGMGCTLVMKSVDETGNCGNLWGLPKAGKKKIIGII